MLLHLLDVLKMALSWNSNHSLSHAKPSSPTGLDHLVLIPEIRVDTSHFQQKLEDPTLPAELKVYYQQLIDQADHKWQEIHLANSQELARRVCLKYIKWGDMRFGLESHNQRDFYDGSSRIQTNGIKFDPVFQQSVLHQAQLKGLDGCYILNHLHVGATSAHRFHNYIKVSNPPTVPKPGLLILMNPKYQVTKCFSCNLYH